MTKAIIESSEVRDDAYHGTLSDRARAIKAEGFRLPENSEENRYGRAVYFWQASQEQARWWAAMRFPGQVIAVGRSKVQLGRHLNCITFEGQGQLREIARKLADRTKLKQITEAAVLNLLAVKGLIHTALVLDLPAGPTTQVFKGAFSVSGARLILCVYRIQNILEWSIVSEELVPSK